MNGETGNNGKPDKNKSFKKKHVKKALPDKNERAGMKKLVKGLLVLLGGMLLLTVGAVAFLLAMHKNSGGEIAEITIPDIIESAIPDTAAQGDIGSGVIDHIVTAGNAVWSSYRKRPETHEVSGSEAEDFASVECIIDPDTKRVSVTASGDGVPKSDDKYYYLFALNTYDSAIDQGSEYIARDYKDNVTNMTAALNYNLSGSRLFKKFVVAVKKDGQYMQVGRPAYITNPEVIAKYTSVYVQPASKKGLLVDPNRLRGNELDDLGVKQAAYNIPVARLLGPSTQRRHSLYL